MAAEQTSRRKRDLHKWVVLGAATCTNLMDYGVMLSFGALFVAMLNTFNEKRSTTVLVGSIFIGFGTTFGVFTGLLLTRFGIKPVAFTGALLVPAGFIISFWATSILYLDISIGFISGIGCALIRVTGVIVTGSSFNGRQKTIALSIESLGTAISGLIFPQLHSFLSAEYGLRGTFLILGGLLLNSLSFALIFSYAVNIKTKDNTSQAERSIDGFHNNAFEGKACTTIDSLMKDSRQEQICITKGSHGTNDPTRATVIHKDVKASKRNAIQDDENGLSKHNKSNKADNTINQEICNGNNEQTTSQTHEHMTISRGKDIEIQKHKHVSERQCHIPTDTTKRNGIQNKNYGLGEQQFDLCSVIFVTFLVGTCFVITCFAGFMTLYQDILISKEFTIHQSNIAYNCYSAFNFASRLLPIVPTRFPRLNAFLIPLISALCGGLAQIFFLYRKSYPIALVGMSLTGICNGAIMSSLQAIVFQIVKPGRQVVGFGLIMGCGGVLSAVVGPIFGTIRDSTQSYDLVLIISCCIYLSAGLLFLVCIAKTSNRKCCHNSWCCFGTKGPVECTKL